jgi:predicted secreted protein
MKTFKYNNYNEYVDSQIEANIRKNKNSYVDPVSLGVVISYIISNFEFNPKFILCHGTRQGFEQNFIKQEFKKHNIDVEILGTEISPTAKNFENTIQWDFNLLKEEWINNVDMIYSNSFDHCYDPNACLDTWMTCIKESGICILEYSPICDVKSSKSDPLGASLNEYKEFITRKYKILDVISNENLNSDKGKSYNGPRYFILITHIT